MVTLGELFRVIDLIGVVTNAILGGIVAREERMDPIGFLTLALLSGLGGGIIRDTLLQHGPPVALTDLLYAVCAIAGAVIAFLVPIGGRAWHGVFPYIDALALGCWATAGAQKTLTLGLGWLPAVLLGTITAVGGGTLRDLTVRRVPQIFGGNTLYATAAVAASAVVAGFLVRRVDACRGPGRHRGRHGIVHHRPVAALACGAGRPGTTASAASRANGCRTSRCGWCGTARPTDRGSDGSLPGAESRPAVVPG